MESRKTNTSLVHIALLMILLVLGAVGFLRSGSLNITNITVQGNQRTSPNEIAQLAEFVRGQNLLLFDSVDLKRKILLHPMVSEVEFERQMPHTLVIRIKERTSCALVLVPKGVIEVDHEGVFLRRLEAWPANDFPLITGIEIPDTAGPGQILNSESLKAALLLIGQAPEGLLSQIGELNVNQVQQLTLFLTNGIEVRLGKADAWTDKMEALRQLLADQEFQSIQQSVKYIDFTAARPVIGRN